MAIVQAENVTKVYGEGITAHSALEHINLCVDIGEFVAIMGPSGGGKSTLLNMLGGLDKPSEGSVYIDGQMLNGMSDDELTALRRRKIGFVFQFYNLIPVLTAVENAAMPVTLDGINIEEAKVRAGEWLAKVGLDDRRDSRPDQLSGGQQQRVAVARALVAEPKLILADEPTGNLDSKASQDIVSLLRQVANEWGRAVIMVTHDARIASYADRIVFLNDGNILFDKLRSKNVKIDDMEWVTDLMRSVT